MIRRRGDDTRREHPVPWRPLDVLEVYQDLISYPKLEEMMKEHGIEVDHDTIALCSN
jgi:hypothetical protein